MRRVQSFQMDLSKAENFKEFADIRPNFIIHCAALTNVDYCEEHPMEAHQINTIMSTLVAQKARQIGAYLIHISTDFVFDGIRGNYDEKDIPNPINVYGRTKLEAEQKVISILPAACIVRTVIYGWNYQSKFSLAEWMISKLKNQEKLTAFRDVQFSPILVNDLAAILFKLEEEKYAGIIHIAAREACSKFEFAKLIAKIFNLDRTLIEPISIDQLELKAPRGKNNSLSVDRAEKILNMKLPTVEDGLEKMRKLQQFGYSGELRNG
ncbi:dTDP-4-dehydrorhamnose reductase [subsurface metagenome]